MMYHNKYIIKHYLFFISIFMKNIFTLVIFSQSINRHYNDVIARV